MSRYDKLAKVSESDFPDKLWDRYGLRESEWKNLSADERVIHYNRQCQCEHKASLFEWPSDLRESYSLDPYAHTVHMETCQRPTLAMKECPCQMCAGRIGQERKS